MFIIIKEAQVILKKNGIEGEVNSWHVTIKRNATLFREIKLLDGRVFHFSRNGVLKKEKVITRKQKRVLARKQIES